MKDLTGGTGTDLYQFSAFLFLRRNNEDFAIAKSTSNYTTTLTKLPVSQCVTVPCALSARDKPKYLNNLITRSNSRRAWGNCGKLC